MFGSQVLEVVIGLAFIYLLLSLICSILNELIARIFAARSKSLEKAVRHFLQSEGAADKGVHITADDFYGHSLIKNLGMQGRMDKILDWIPGVNRKGLPSYIPSGEFVLALFDTVVGAGRLPFELEPEQTAALEKALVLVAADDNGSKDIEAAKALEDIYENGLSGSLNAALEAAQIRDLSRGKGVLTGQTQKQLQTLIDRASNLKGLFKEEQDALNVAISLVSDSTSLEKLRERALDGSLTFGDNENAAMILAIEIVTNEEHKSALQGLKARTITSGLTKEDLNSLQKAVEMLQRDKRLEDVKKSYAKKSMVGLTVAEIAALESAKTVLEKPENPNRVHVPPLESLFAAAEDIAIYFKELSDKAPLNAALEASKTVITDESSQKQLEDLQKRLIDPSPIDNIKTRVGTSSKLDSNEKAVLQKVIAIFSEYSSQIQQILDGTAPLTTPFELDDEEQQTLKQAIKALPLGSPIKQQLLDIQNQSTESRDLQTYSHTMFMQIQGGIEKLDDKSPVKQPLNNILNNAMAGAKDWDQALAKARKGVETWFDNYMERVTGWYKRNTQTVILMLAFIIAFVGNVDTIVISKKLWVDATLRESVANQATTFVVQADTNSETSDSAEADAETDTTEAEPLEAEPSDVDQAAEDPAAEESPVEEQTAEDLAAEESPVEEQTAELPPVEEQIGEETTTEPTVAKLQEELRGLGLPIGWFAKNDNEPTFRDNFLVELPVDKAYDDLEPADKKVIDERLAELTENGQNWEAVKNRWPIKAAGLLMTALLVSLGAPFWFELLSKLVNMRSTGNLDDGSKKNQSDANLEAG